MSASIPLQPNSATMRGRSCFESAMNLALGFHLRDTQRSCLGPALTESGCVGPRPHSGAIQLMWCGSP